MSQAVFEQILIGIQSLPPESLAKLREILSAPGERVWRLEAARALALAEEEDGIEDKLVIRPQERA